MSLSVFRILRSAVRIIPGSVRARGRLCAGRVNPTKKLYRFLVMVGVSVWLAPFAPARADLETFATQVKELTLDNGMKFILLRRAGAPVFSAYIQVKVGGMDEPAGKTGIAHLLEHMAFKGTSQIGTRDYPNERVLLDEIERLHARGLAAPDREKQSILQQKKERMAEAAAYVDKEAFSKIYLRNGGSDLNATTSQDLTSYFVTLPNTKLELWASLESARLRDPVFREFYTEQQVVMEERRMRSEDSPFGRLYEALMDVAFEDSPYRRPTIGYAKDIQSLSATDLRQFYERYYVPSNMVVALVGDIDANRAEEVIRRYFAPLPPGRVERPDFLRERAPQAEKKVYLSMQASPAMISAYLKPAAPQRDDYLFDVLDTLLCEGSNSRLYRRLVESSRLAQQIGCSSSSPGSRAENLFFIYLALAKSHSAEEALSAIDQELSDLLGRGLKTGELERAKKKLLSSLYYDLQSNDSLAEMLSECEALWGDWRYLVQYPRQIESVSEAELLGAVRTYLAPQRRRTVVLKPSTVPSVK